MYALVVEKGRSGVLIDSIEQFVDDFNNENDVVAVANHNSVIPQPLPSWKVVLMASPDKW